MTYKQLRTLKVAICCLARDCGIRLTHNIPKLERLGSHFKETAFFVVENNSKDNTRQILNTWQKKSIYTINLPSVKKYHSKVGNIAIDFDRDDLDLSHYKYRQRMARISLARDTYLDAVRNSTFFPNLLLMCDADVFNFSIDGIIDTLISPNTWDVVLAHGFMYECHILKTKPIEWKKVYYDTYATELVGDTSMKGDIKRELAPLLSRFMQKPEWLQVNSAFGGIGIYKYDILHKTNITYLNAIEQQDRNFCEHLSFHHQLKSRGYQKIFINPNMQVAYNTKFRAFIRKILTILKIR